MRQWCLEGSASIDAIFKHVIFARGVRFSKNFEVDYYSAILKSGKATEFRLGGGLTDVLGYSKYVQMLGKDSI